MIGDRYCDDTTNTLECSFDGGDCCGPDINTQYCSDCQCLDGEGGRGNFGKGVNQSYDILFFVFNLCIYHQFSSNLISYANCDQIELNTLAEKKTHPFASV